MGFKSSFNNKLLDYLDIHAGRTAVIFGNGPTLNEFSYDTIPEEEDDIITLGTNSIVFHENLSLDYYFCGDNNKKVQSRRAELEGLSQFDATMACHASGRIKRQIFCCTLIDGKRHAAHFTQQEADAMGAISYEITHIHRGEIFAKRIDENRVCGHSIIFSCFQFALFAGCKKIYVVGCDGAGSKETFRELNRPWPGSPHTYLWKSFREFANLYYPDVRIVSINPHQLRKFFHEDIFSDYRE